MTLLRDEINKKDLDSINIEISALQKMIDVLLAWKEKHGEYDYVDERLNLLYGRQAEFLIAREDRQVTTPHKS
jgi:hypothetical protein